MNDNNKNEAIKNPLFWTDGYKMCHKDQFPKGTEWMYETWTARKSRVDGVNHCCFFGLQGALKEITEQWDEHFFKGDIAQIEKDYKEAVKGIFGVTNPEFANNIDTKHLRDLHKLGHLPIKVKALPEGTFAPIGVPMLTIENTTKDSFWLPGFMETQLSAWIWAPMTAATIGDKYKRILNKYAAETGDEKAVFSQAGDFSMRGMTSPESAMRVSNGHLLSFGGTSTVNALNYLKKYYGADNNAVAYTPSTEHSVMCSWGKDEYQTYKELVTKIYPSGNVSIVSDTWDLWNVVSNILPKLKDEIMARQGKVLIRPDSGDPVKIICGDKESKDKDERAGLIERLYQIFGGKKNQKGFIELAPQIGGIYGDSITPDRAVQICEGLKEKGFATTNIKLGVGSYTYQYNTRDTLGFALKATATITNGEFKQIYKDPKTDGERIKKSQKGMVAVVERDGELALIDGLDPKTAREVEGNKLETVYQNGKFVREQTFAQIRETVAKESERVYGKAQPTKKKEVTSHDLLGHYIAFNEVLRKEWRAHDERKKAVQISTVTAPVKENGEQNVQ
jgi:nicotinamide phosphoribosyltransferase